LGKERVEKAKELKCQGGKSEASAKVEELAYGEKIAKALTSCEAYLEKSVVAVKSMCEESDNWVWHAAAELEYALFLFSLRNSDEDVTSEWKNGSHDRSGSTAKLLNTVQDLIARSKESVASGSWLKAHKYAYVAQSALLRIQREHTRKKRGSSGK
jgi:HSP90 family molecular chaperone